MTELKQHADALMTFLQRRGLSPGEACAVMGISLVCLVGNEETLRDFIRQLEEDFAFNRGREIKH